MPSAKLVYRMLAVSAEALCRHSFGSRYAPQLISSFLLALVYAVLIGIATPQQPPRLFGAYLWIFFGQVCYHLAGMFRPRVGPVHSYLPGQSWSFWRRLRIRPNLVQLLCEPGLVVLLGWIVSPADMALSVWLQLAGVCLFIKELIFQWKQHSRMLDALDARAEGERLNTGIRQRTAPEANGEQTATPVVSARPAVPAGNPAGQFIRNLDPALQRLLNAGNQPPQNPARGTRQNHPPPRRNQVRQPGPPRVRILRTRPPPPR